MSQETISPETIEPIAVQSWTQSIIRPTLIILMVTAIMGAVLSAINLLVPEQNWTYTFLICFGLILESHFTTVWLNQPARRSVEHLRYRAAELFVIALFIRIVTWAIQGSWPETGAWLAYLSDPILLFRDGYFWGTLILSIIAWQRTIAISSSFSRMKPDDAERAYYGRPRQERDPGSQPMSDDRSHLLHNFAQQFLGGGMVVLFCAALASFDLPQLDTMEHLFSDGITRLGLSPGMLASLLLYFLCGFLLLSQGRLAVLEMRWLAGEATQRRPIGRHWLRRTLFVLLAVGLFAAFLPIGSTMPFMRILNLILFVIINFITLLVYLVSMLIYLLLSIIFPRSADPEGSSAPPPPPPPPPQMEPAAVNETLQIIFSSAFWAVVVIMSIAAVLFFLRDRGFRINNTTLRRIWLTLRLWWRQLRQGINDQMQDIQGSLQTLFYRDKKTADGGQPPWRFIRLNALSPREKIRYFYLSTVKRADQSGVERQKSETPLEFAVDLKTNWPEAEEEIDELTQAFLEARYSPAPIEETDIPPIQKQWKQLKSNLRKRRQNRNTPPEN
ncbi:MAG: DUF4129 domain-containing protein [Chloroflexota bacterium]